MRGRILITGGAGFIGSHLADHLLRAGYHVRILDSLVPQVHGGGGRPEYLDPNVELIEGDVRDADVTADALDGVESVVHLAAMVGVGQSMYRIDGYTSVNNLGTAVLLQTLLERPVKRLVVASSMSVYGEGLYQDESEQLHHSAGRSLSQLAGRQWEPLDDRGVPLRPVPTPESKHPALESVYALSKYDQEQMCLMVGRAYRIPTVALRFFNVYGTRQALSNPYTGVLAIFASRLLNDKPPVVFEDGNQRRDFVSVHDVARACMLALDADEAEGLTINIGSGRSYTVREVAARLARVLGKTDVAPEMTEQYRVGDIRHCFADVGLARRVLGYEPRVDIDTGLRELSEWLVDQAATDRVHEARHELAARGLTV